MRLVLTNGLDVWLQLRYAHTHDCIPFERAYARPIPRPACLMMLAYSPVLPRPYRCTRR